jgi:hypothetical protein
MLAILYLAGMICFGDCICRYFYRFVSLWQRLATSFLVGLLLSSGITYLGSLAFAWTTQPLIMGNVIFLGALILAAVKMPCRPPSSYLDKAVSRPPGNNQWDWLCLGLCSIFGCWLMWTTLSFPNGNFQFAFKSWSDFGANLSVSQSFLLGHNFPSEHPFFPGETLRYHFLFWFQGANLAFLGLSLVASINLLSVLSLISLVILVMTFAELLFASRAVGRIAVALFFFASSSLSYIPFLRAQTSLGGTLAFILHTTQFLNSGYRYRGEDWGALTVGIFGNQRHLISGVGILFVVLIFLLDLYQHQTTKDSLVVALSDKHEVPPSDKAQQFQPSLPEGLWEALRPLVFSGALIGLLPYWNGAVFVSAFIVLGSLWFFFPYRRYLSCLIGTAILVGLPQVLLLRSGNLAETGQSLFHWGYTIPDPKVLLVVQYLAWTFGFKWLLIVVALWFLSGAHRRLFLAFSSLVPVVFLLQLSTDSFNNHKLLNIWNIFATVYVAYALWRIGRASVSRAGLAIVLALLMVFGAFVDLFAIRNDSVITIPYNNDRLVKWLRDNTKPSDVFLTHTFLTHPILFSGRKVFLGYTLFAWTAGYNVSAREALYRQMFRERDRDKLVRLLRDNQIAYVGIDSDLRGSSLIAGSFSESVFQQNFPVVFEDTEHRYANLTIYRVPSQ